MPIRDKEQAASSEADSVVELKEVAPGVYEPTGEIRNQTRSRVTQSKMVIRKPRSAEDELKLGFKIGMDIVRKMGKVLNVKL